MTRLARPRPTAAVSSKRPDLPTKATPCSESCMGLSRVQVLAAYLRGKPYMGATRTRTRASLAAIMCGSAYIEGNLSEKNNIATGLV
jgi:hypothetical protein